MRPHLVPLSLPAERLTAALTAVWDAGDAAIVLPADGAPAAPALPAAVVAALDGALALPDDAALVVLTSGSTGRARAIVCTHAALAASTRAGLERLGARPGQRWALALPTHHIAGLQVLLRARALGTDPVIVDRPGDAASLAAALAAADHVALVPTQLARLHAAGADLTGLASVLVGGGPAEPGLLAAVRATGARLVTSYGMTETCGGCVYDGRPLDGVRVAVDAEGRIRLAGPVLAVGELGAPDGRGQGFGADGWFTTNDRGRLEDGRLVVEGRVDDVVVSGGENVPTPAVAAALRTHPGVADAVALGRDDAEWGRLVVAVVVPRDPTAPPTLDDLRAHVRRTLPAAHAPRALALVEGIARDAMGKVTADERARLLAAEVAGPPTGA